jgi:hypothetical protein
MTLNTLLYKLPQDAPYGREAALLTAAVEIFVVGQ